jgi:hypothetical protein
MKDKFFFLLVGAISLLFLALLITNYRRMIGASSTTTSQFQQAIVREKVRMVGKVISQENDSLRLELFEGRYTAMRNTHVKLNITKYKEAKVVMGTLKDIKRGAIIQVNGRKIDRNVVEAEGVAILTKYVQY